LGTSEKKFPQEWVRIVDLYTESRDDATDLVKASLAAAAGDTNNAAATCRYCCDVCGKRFKDARYLATHKWALHKVKSSLRNRTGDLTQCPVCKVDVHNRVRFVKHLLERRVRAKHRTVSCREAFEALNMPEVPQALLNKLEAKDFWLRERRLESLVTPTS